MPKKRTSKAKSISKPPAQQKSIFMHLYTDKRKHFLALATLLFALAISFAMVKKLSGQGRTISYTVSLVIFIISLLLHYILIYKKKDKKIPLFHHRHHLKVSKFYFIVIIAATFFTTVSHALTASLITISEFIFIISIGTILSLITYEMTD